MNGIGAGGILPVKPYLMDEHGGVRLFKGKRMDWFLDRARPAVESALVEDIEGGDVTTLATIPAGKQARGRFLAKAAGVVAGLDVAGLTYLMLAESQANGDLAEPELSVGKGDGSTHLSAAGNRQPVSFRPCVGDGAEVAAGTEVAWASGCARTLLTAERVALNFLQRMSGIATLTRRYVEAARGTGAVILDTRKTAPGLRLFDKRAVALGGGSNHRFGLFDMALVKDNHITAAGGIAPAVEGIRSRYQDIAIEVEVADFAQLKEALTLDVDRILLDNMVPDQIRKAVRIAAGRTPLEASGGVVLENVAEVAATGVDFISVGALTHSAPALDISFDLEMAA